jgi:hypothetical protein
LNGMQHWLSALLTDSRTLPSMRMVKRRPTLSSRPERRLPNVRPNKTDAQYTGTMGLVKTS